MKNRLSIISDLSLYSDTAVSILKVEQQVVSPVSSIALSNQDTLSVTSINQLDIGYKLNVDIHHGQRSDSLPDMIMTLFKNPGATSNIESVTSLTQQIDEYLVEMEQIQTAHEIDKEILSFYDIADETLVVAGLADHCTDLADDEIMSMDPDDESSEIFKFQGRKLSLKNSARQSIKKQLRKFCSLTKKIL